MKALKYLSYVGKLAGFVAALDTLPFIDPKLVMEALHVAVLPRAARINVERLDARSRQPLLQRLGDELRAVVTADVAGLGT